MLETLQRLLSYSGKASDEAMNEVGRLVERGGFQLLVDTGGTTDRYALVDLVVPSYVKRVEWMDWEEFIEAVGEKLNDGLIPESA